MLARAWSSPGLYPTIGTGSDSGRIADGNTGRWLPTLRDPEDHISSARRAPAVRQRWYEAFSVCQHCDKSTVFVVAQKESESSSVLENATLADLSGSLNHFVKIESFINIKHLATTAAPDHVPANIAAAFNEGATCAAVECHNAAGAMFRLCIDLATKPLLPPEGHERGPSWKIRRDLGLRLPWLFDNGKLPSGLRELSTSIREDGKDGAHGRPSQDEADELLRAVALPIKGGSEQETAAAARN